MNFQYIKILLAALVLIFISQGCLPPPPPHYHHHYRHWHGSSQQQSQALARLANQHGGDSTYEGELGK